MNYRQYIEKTAQSRWRKYLDSKKNESELYEAVSDMTRNEKLRHNNPADSINRKNVGNDVKTLKQQLSKNVFHKPRYVPEYEKILNTRALDLDEKSFEKRRRFVENKRDFKESLRETPKRYNSYGPMKDNKDIQSLKDVGPEDYVDIIHGTNKAKAEAFLRGGNGASRLESMTNLGQGKFNDMGIQVHSRIKERAPQYADMQSKVKGGHPAVVEGRIKRKFLYHNQGDEYGIPEEFFNKIEDAKVYNPNTKEVSMSIGKNKSLPYGRTKTPGDLTALEKATNSNKNRRDFELVGNGKLTPGYERPKKKINNIPKSTPIPQNNSLVPLAEKGFTMKGKGTLEYPIKPTKPPTSLIKSSQNSPVSTHKNIINQAAKKGLSRNSKLALGLGAGTLALGAGAYGINKMRKDDKNEL